MSLYNAVIRANRAGRMLFATIEVDPSAVPRLRDIWINRDLTEVTVFTRTGGGNREEYREQNDQMRYHPGFLRDADWVVDPTYAEWVYSVPEPRRQVLLRDIGGRPEAEQAKIYSILTADATAKWNAMMASLATRS